MGIKGLDGIPSEGTMRLHLKIRFPKSRSVQVPKYKISTQKTTTVPNVETLNILYLGTSES